MTTIIGFENAAHDCCLVGINGPVTCGEGSVGAQLAIQSIAIAKTPCCFTGTYAAFQPTMGLLRELA
ncbi:MAG: hypothetical protein O9254_00070 [Rhodobacteraceae bacterium]|nr:hypothetical protein [Paracoccaceae bacterium]